MSVTSGFFNSHNNDRRYNAEQISAIFDGVINDGIFANIGTAFAVNASADNTVVVGIGRAWFNSTWLLNDAPLPIELDASEILLDRYDAIVIEINHDDSVRNGTIKVVKGTPASSATYPQLTRTKYVNQYPLAYIYRKAGSSTVTQANITNAIGTSSCPYVTGILQVQDIDNIVAQWQAQWNEWYANETSESAAEFDAWMEALKTVTDDDAVASLAAAIIELQGHTHTAEDVGAVPLSGTFFQDGDFNTFTTAGRYDIGGNSMKNAPKGTTETGYYRLDVSQFSSETVQFAVSWWTAEQFIRKYDTSAGAWGAWIQVFTTANKPTAADVGAIGTYSRSDIGTTPNFDNPGVNGVFEVRSSSEIPNATGTAPYNGFGPMLSMRTPDGLTMIQIAAQSDGSFYARAAQGNNVNMSNKPWQKIYTTGNKPTAADVGAVPFVTYGNVTNLDDLTEPGMYSCDATNGTATNIPMVSYAFALLVEKYTGWGGQPIQTFTDYYTKRTFKRSKMYDGASFVWNEWAEIMTSETVTHGTTDLAAGSSSLTTGAYYNVYE